MSKIKIIITLGPSTSSRDAIKKIKQKKVDFVRANLSHTSIEELKYYINLAKSQDIPFILDTEGSQIRSGELIEKKIEIKSNKKIKLHRYAVRGDSENINLNPENVFDLLNEGDLIHIDFDSLLLCVYDISMSNEDYIICEVIQGGTIGENKGVVVEPRIINSPTLPTLSNKDRIAIKIGLKENLGYIAFSFARSKEAIKEVRSLTKNKMKIISKIECIDGLKNLDDIIKYSDMILIDRGDLSKEIPIKKIPLTQKIIINKARVQNTPVYVATNFLENMVENRQPTKAEVHDSILTVIDGADGLILSAETAIGKYPINSINILKNLINHADNIREFLSVELKNELKQKDIMTYINSQDKSIDNMPHGGILINKFSIEEDKFVDSRPFIEVNNIQRNEIENIATGVYSPITGFLGKNDLIKF